MQLKQTNFRNRNHFQVTEINKEKGWLTQPPFLCNNLLFYDFQDFHGASLDADTASDALGCRAIGLHHDHLHGASLGALTTADAQLLIDHINAGLGVLGDGTVLTDLHALTAGDAGHRLSACALCNDLDAAQVRMEFLVESGRASADALQASHTLNILLNSKLLHSKGFPSSLYF